MSQPEPQSQRQPTIIELGDALHELLCPRNASFDCEAYLRPEYDTTSPKANHEKGYGHMAEQLLESLEVTPARLKEILEEMSTCRP